MVISLIVIYEIFRGRLDSEAISIIHIVHREICGEQSPNIGGGGCRCGQMANASCERAQLQDVIARVTRLTDFAKLWEWMIQITDSSLIKPELENACPSSNVIATDQLFLGTMR